MSDEIGCFSVLFCDVSIIYVFDCATVYKFMMHIVAAAYVTGHGEGCNCFHLDTVPGDMDTVYKQAHSDYRGIEVSHWPASGLVFHLNLNTQLFQLLVQKIFRFNHSLNYFEPVSTA